MNKQGIAVKIALYTGMLILFVCAGLGILSYRNGSSAVLGGLEQALELQAIEASKYVESRFEVHLSVLETIAASSAIKSMDWQLQRPLLQEEIQRLTDFLELGIVDRSGLARYADGSTASLGDRDYVITA